MIRFLLTIPPIFAAVLAIGFWCDFRKEPIRSPSAAKRLLREYFCSKSAVRYFLLILIFLLACLNHWLWSGHVLLTWWERLPGTRFPELFYPVEEWIALHSHHNEWPVSAGYGIVMIILLLQGKILPGWKLHHFGYALCGFLFAACLICSLPCLCLSPERISRQMCPLILHDFQKQFEIELKRTGGYPSSLPEAAGRSGFQRTFSYPGRGRKTAEDRFVVVEDEPRSHAGDLRHRLWSDGSIDSYYPWKTQNGAGQ